MAAAAVMVTDPADARHCQQTSSILLQKHYKKFECPFDIIVNCQWQWRQRNTMPKIWKWKIKYNTFIAVHNTAIHQIFVLS